MCLDQKIPYENNNTLALPVLLYGSETRAVKARNASKISAAEMKYTRRTIGYTGTDFKQIHKLQKSYK
jgi:hypothetical protein